MRLLLFLLFSLTSCATYKQAPTYYHTGRIEEAEECLKKADKPYTAFGNSTLLLLERALIRFAKQETKKSLQDFQAALSAIDYYRRLTPQELTLQMILEDTMGPYIPPPFEKTLAYLYCAFAFLEEGDEENATALLSYVENHREQHEEENPVATYLLALLLNRRGDTSNAEVLLRRLNISDTPSSTLLIIHEGRSPQKISKTSPVSLASLAVLEELFGSAHIRPALSSLVGISLPELVYFPSSPSIPTPFLTFDIGKAAQKQLHQDLPVIAVKAAARLLIRRGVIATHPKEHTLVDIGMAIANLSTQADTRSWGCLPEKISLYLPPEAQKIFPLEGKVEEIKIMHLFRESS